MSRAQHQPTDPDRPQTAVGTYDRYAEAERAVELLSDRHFPVDRATIVGRGLHSFEQVAAGPGSLGVASTAAGFGALIGAPLGWFFSAFGWVDPVVSTPLLIGYGALCGGLLAGVVGLVAHIVRGPGGTPVVRMRADSYDVLTDAEFAPRAAQLLDSPDAPVRRVETSTPSATIRIRQEDLPVHAQDTPLMHPPKRGRLTTDPDGHDPV